ncbi:hypothetical protein BC832DRAFT_460595 [Gaertneriomyces semiglobifer]|nr:hypothetical protein BC832DRAFT_460595 [Gaertneriomyces semiglobifer]
MARVQTALKKQLTEHLERITLDLREKESAVRAAIQRRETIGVELYNLQQQLAKQQAALDSAQEQLGMVQSGRQEAEGKLQNVNEEWKEIKDRCRKGERSLDQHKSEMERISRAIKQVDLYNDELRSKILVAKRGTMKAEEDLVKQEQEKKRQDYFIDTLTEQLRKLQERRALYETQLLAQQKETRAALDTLQEAGLEMEAIQFEKRQLLHHWKSSLIGLQRREETLQALSAQIQTQKDTLLSMTNELNGFRHSLRAAQETNESLTVLLNKLEKEIERMKREIGRLEAEKDKMKESYGTWSKMLRQTEGELGVVMQERQTLQAELASIQKQTLQTHAATQNLQSQIAELLQNQLSLVKGNQSTRRELTTTLRHEIHEKESVIASVQNDLASTRLEGLNITARVKGMKEQLENLDREITQRNKELERYEVEIRRGNDELTKKQGEMDALNRKYDRLIAKSQDESTGPLEATIHNLLKSLALKQKETVQLSQFWLTSQTHLVHLTKKTSAISESTQDARMKLTVLNRKKMVVDSAFENECKEIKEYQRSIRGLRVQMEKVNGLLGRQVKEQNRLEEGNLGLEQEFRGRLKDAELESLHMEQQLEHLKSEKQKALQGLIEAERQLLLWQKKTQLARETQLALDPNVGAIEIKEMQAEIHRMKLRHASMLKLQEKMVSEMERSVWRRESIHQRVTGGGTTKGVAKKTSGGVMIQKEIVELGRRVKRVLDDLRECDEDMKSLTTSRHQMTHQITQAKQSLSQLISKQEDLQTQLEDLQTEKNLLTSQTLLHQRSARRYTLVTPSTTTTNNNNTSNTNTTTPRYTYYIKDPALRPSELESQQLRLSKIQSVIQTVASEVGDARIKMALDGVGRLVATNNQ